MSFQGTGTAVCAAPPLRAERASELLSYYYTNQVTGMLRDMQPENFRYLLLETLIRMDEQRRGPQPVSGRRFANTHGRDDDRTARSRSCPITSLAVGENSDVSELTFIEENDCVPNGSCRRRQMTSLQELKKEHGLDVLCLQEFRLGRALVSKCDT